MNDYSPSSTQTFHGIMTLIFTIMLIESVGRLIYSEWMGMGFSDGRWITLCFAILGVMVSGVLWVKNRRRYPGRELLF